MVKRLVMICLAVLIFAVPVGAVDTLECSDEYSEMLDSLPEDIRELLPKKLFSSDINEIGEGAGEAVSFGYIVGIIIDELAPGIKSALKLLAALLGLFTTKNILPSDTFAFALSPIISVMVFAVIYAALDTAAQTVLPTSSSQFTVL